MHCALGRANGDIQKNSDRARDSLSRKEQKSFGTSLEDCEAPFATWRNSDRRCSILTFLSLEPDGHWRVVALPSQCPANINHLVSDALVNMDRLHLVYPPPIYPFKVNRQKGQKRPPLDVTYPVKSFTSRRFTGSTLRHPPRNKTLEGKATKWNGISRKPLQKSLTCSNSSSTIPNSPNAINSSNMSIGDAKIYNVAKRSLKKKSRKKGNKSKKFSCNTGSSEPEVLSEEYANGSSASETCGKNDGNRQVPSLTAPEISLPESVAKNSETSKTCTSSSDEVLLLKDSGFPIFDGVEGINTQTSCYNDMYSKGYTDMHDSFAFDSVSVGSNSDASTNAGHDEKHAEKEICKIDISEPPDFTSRKGYFSCQSSLNDVVDTYDYTEGTRHGNRGCRSSDTQSVLPNKRSTKNKVATRSVNASKFGSVGTLHIRTGKENSHSVWQKVQRKDSNDCSGELKKPSVVYARFDLPLREAPLLKRQCNAADMKSEDKKQQKDKVSKKLKRKTSPALKQEYNCYSRKGSLASMAGLDGCVKERMERNDISDILCQVKKKGFNLVSRSCSLPSCPRAGFQSSKVECMTKESVHSMRLYPKELGRLESVCHTFSGMKNQSVGIENISMQSPVYRPHLPCNAASQEVQKETSFPENSRQNSGSSVSFTHKWMPIGLKNPGLTSSTRSGTSSLEHSDEAASKRWIFKDTAKANVVSNSQSLLSEVPVVCAGQSSGGITSSSHGIEGRLSKSSTTEKLINNKLDAANRINNSEVSEDRNAFEADSNRIQEAVNNSCRAQLASEAVQMATGRPIAEFERLLHYSSPVIHQSPSHICHTCCSRNHVDQVGGVLLCRHETPNITLGCLWKWYEKYGSYGLEIKAEEFGNSKRLGADRFAFRAYFVPYLSGIQLFRNGNTDSAGTNNRLHNSSALSACGKSKTSEKSSSIGSLPIFSVLFPQPDHEKDAVTAPLANQLSISEQSFASAKDVSVRLTGTTRSADLELLFEYFESEQPQERRPLYDKIQQLVRGDGLSHSKVFGDPTKLDSINLNDLHPRSWYSVAWYPIYRIPDGNFHAAFLTYHSLGHLVHRSGTFESHNVDACIVSPVVGLQSYNAQSECWFELRPSALMQTTVTPGLNPRGVLAERLRTLEETASLMARAVVNKGSMASVNKHPDYEFFLSRRRW